MIMSSKNKVDHYSIPVTRVVVQIKILLGAQDQPLQHHHPAVHGHHVPHLPQPQVGQIIVHHYYHLPLLRLFLSVYEAVMINSILHCQSKRMVCLDHVYLIPIWLPSCQGITPIWYLYAMASVQLLQVINTSLNFPIYWFVGNFRETFIHLFSFKQCFSTESHRSIAEEWDTQMSCMSRRSSTLSINHGGKIETDIFEKILKTNNNSQSWT